MIAKEERFKAIVKDNGNKISRICRYYAPTLDDQKDMYQEVLINIWKSLDSFRGDSDISTWLYRIAVNTSLNYAGKEYRYMKLNVDSESESLKNVFEEEDKELIESQFLALQVELNKLCVIDKAIIGLVIEGLSMKKIADIIGITEPNVRVKIHRIKTLIRENIKQGRQI